MIAKRVRRMLVVIKDYAFSVHYGQTRITISEPFRKSTFLWKRTIIQGFKNMYIAQLQLFIKTVALVVFFAYILKGDEAAQLDPDESKQKDVHSLMIRETNS